MSSVIFIFNGVETNIQCLKNEKMKEICNKYISKIQSNINDIYFIYGSNKLNLELTFDEIANEVDRDRNIMNILVYEYKIIKNDGLKKSRDIRRKLFNRV